jgi:hypothetical protein
MRTLLRKIIHILDGTPAVYGNRTRGQSVVELALVSPILIILIMGLVEIGWFANNYMILLESTRTGARLGTVLNGSSSPLVWNNDGSSLPGLYGADPLRDPLRQLLRNCGEVGSRQDLQGFYSLIACTAQTSLDPLELRFGVDPKFTDGRFYPDEVVVSAFALQLVNPAELDATLRSRLDTADGVPPSAPRVLVVGRYPTNANECTVRDASGTMVLNPWERDPFDYIVDGIRNYKLVDTSKPDTEDNRRYFELPGFDAVNAGDDRTWERQKGFVFSGQHRIEGTGHCFGSEWDISEVQRLINLPNFSLIDNNQRARLATMGMVLVEMFWQHELLLKNPIFNPVFTILGNQTTIGVWSAFPVPAVEPRIRFN